MTCNNPNGCDCPNTKFCKWWGNPKKKSSGKFGKRTKLKPVSDKQKEQNAIYSQLRVVFLRKFNKCQISAIGCTGASTDVHHSDKRGKNTNRVETWVACCRHCHDWTHSNPRQAREIGLL